MAPGPPGPPGPPKRPRRDGSIGGLARSVSAFSSQRRVGLAKNAGTSREGDTSTILPFSLPFHCSNSSALSMMASTASPLTGPSVPGVHAFGKASSGKDCGAVIVATIRSLTQPRPNGPQASSATFASP